VTDVFSSIWLQRKIFLDLNNNNNQPICLIYSKGRAWLKHVGLSNLLYACITIFITNHAPIGKYRLMFFPNKLSTCLCNNSSVNLSRQGHTFYMSVFDIWSYLIPNKSPSKIFSYFSSSIWEIFTFKKTLQISYLLYYILYLV